MTCRHILEFQQFCPGADLFFGSIGAKTASVFDRYAAAEDAADTSDCLFHTGDAGCAEGNDGLSAEIIAFQECINDAGFTSPPYRETDKDDVIAGKIRCFRYGRTAAACRACFFCAAKCSGILDVQMRRKPYEDQSDRTIECKTGRPGPAQ